MVVLIDIMSMIQNPGNGVFGMEEKQLKQELPQETNIASIGNQYTKEQIQEFNKAQKRVIFRRRRLAVVFAVAIVFFVLSGFNLFRSYQHINSLKAEKVAAEVQQAELNQRVVALEYDVKLLEDEEYLQKLARQKYFYTKEGELVYNIPQINQNVRTETKTKEQPTKQSSTKNSSNQ